MLNTLEKIVYLKIKIKICWQKKVETKSKEQKIFSTISKRMRDMPI